jgi:flagellar P-ring protein precursor FlgI
MSINSPSHSIFIRLMLGAMALVTIGNDAFATTKLRSICRVKGQEENTLSGLGLVVGLNGTGEPNDPLTMRAIARSMEILGNPLAMNGQQADIDELRRLKNAALVMVTATVPATGARRGDLLDCNVSAINGKSLVGGRLAFAALQGPNTQDRRVFALCQGPITIDNPQQPMVGSVHSGCQMEADVFTKFFHDGFVTLVLDSHHANFQTADVVAEEIKSKYSSSTRYGGSMDELDDDDVVAINAANIRVRIPDEYNGDEVSFVAKLLNTNVYEPEPEARVTVNSRAGSIVISGDVEIGDVIVTHKNTVIETTSSVGFTAIDPDQSGKAKLDELINQLNALKVSTEDMIEIIRGIERNGKLHGKLIIDK